VATVAVAVVPWLPVLMLLGWLRVAHAPSLSHLLVTLQQAPALRALGPHPSLARVLGALDFGRRYIASISLGLCAYAVDAAQRWIVLSTDPRLRRLSPLLLLLILFPILMITGGAIRSFILMTPGRGTPLTYAPSTLLIALHFAFAAAVVLGCLRIVRNTEL